MARENIKQNNPNQNRSRKPLVVAVSVICALSVILIVFLACKNSLFFALSEYKAENGRYSEALELVEDIRTDEAQALAMYLELRCDFNQNYPLLLSDFQPSIIARWTESVNAIEQVKHFLSDEISADADEMSEKLRQVNSCLNQYGQIRGEILSLMDVFAELNRLYTKDITGKNTSFTVSEERIKVSSWEQQLSTLVTEHTVTFVQLVLIFAMSESLANPLITAMLATGKIRNYQIIVGGLQMMNLPVSYVFLRMNYPPESVFIIAIVISTCCEMARLYMLRDMIGLSVKKFLSKVYFNVIIVSVVAAIIPYFVIKGTDTNFINFVFTSLLCIGCTIVSILYAGCTSKERLFVAKKLKVIKNKILKH